MTNYDSAALQTAATDDSTDLEPRDVRALTEVMTVLEDVGRVRGAVDLYLVVSRSGSEYLVDASLGACECADAEYRDERCKHQRRVAFATGERTLPAWVEGDGVDDGLGRHVSSGPQQVATDGGRLVPDRRDQQRQRVPVAGGVLVYESCDPVGRELVGFEDVADWDSLRSALATRGHDTGAIHHKPVLDDSGGDR